ncbi:MAG: non-heme iron oxygenase ferredoxin subunit [Dehalococcoidia bacterium]
MAQFVKVARASEVEPGQVKVAIVGERRIALCNVDGVFYAIDDVCTHDGGSLDQGELDEYAIECPRHGARFDVRSGKVLALPAVKPVATYQVKVEDGDIAVALP